MSTNLQSLQNKAETATFNKFIVDFFPEKDDMIYHFYPNPIEQPFQPGFHVALEEAFKQTLPEDADVRAEFIETYEMKMYQRGLRPEDNPHSSFCIRVKGLASRPFSDIFLKKRVFNSLDELTR